MHEISIQPLQPWNDRRRYRHGRYDRRISGLAQRAVRPGGCYRCSYCAKVRSARLGLSFVCWTPKQKLLGNKEARQKPTLQGASASQVTENKTFVEVHTTGR